MPEIVAAVCLGQLENYKYIVKKRQNVADRFSKEIIDCSWLKPQKKI